MNPNVSGSPPGAHQRQSPHTNRYAPYASPSPPGYPYTYLNQGGAGGGGGGGHMIPSNNQFHQSHQFPFDPYQNIYRPAAAFNNNRPPVYPTSQQQYSYNSYQDFNNQHQNPSPPHPNRSFSPGHYQQNRYQNRVIKNNKQTLSWNIYLIMSFFVLSSHRMKIKEITSRDMVEIIIIIITITSNNIIIDRIIKQRRNVKSTRGIYPRITNSTVRCAIVVSRPKTSTKNIVALTWL